MDKNNDIVYTEKRRGRPPKDKNTIKQTKPKTVVDKTDTDELVLYLPTFDDDSDTIYNSDSDNNKQENKQENVNNDNTDIQPYRIDLVNKQIDTNNIETLLNEIHKRDLMIINMKSKLANTSRNKDNENLILSVKDNKKKLMNLNLITLENKKLVVQEKTDLVCWWCTYNFDTIPCFLPEKYYDGKYHVFGNFCSFGCVFAYNDNIDDYKRLLRESLIRKLYKDIFNKECKVKRSGTRELLEKFGGPLDINTYRDSCSIINKNINLTLPPMIPLLSYYEEHNIAS
jgi:hypothetical protein